MPRLIKRISKTIGLAPGTLMHVGEKRTERVKITVIDYDEKQVQEKEIKAPEECFSFRDTSTVTWINIDGIHNIEIIEKIGKHFGFHPLMLEDIVNTGQRPKLEDFESYIFIVLKMLYFDEKAGEINAEQVSLVLGSNFVISFQEKEGDVFDHVRERIRNAKSRIRGAGADYLVYSLMDAVVDNYFLILEKSGEKIGDMEERIIANPIPKTLQIIHRLKGDIIFLRKSVWPLREVVSVLERSESKLIKKPTRIFLRDVYDHTVQVIDTIETYRDVVSGMLDIYLSSVSNRMNEVMKVLTVIATIFIPLTFIVGIYGMNFRYMPELQWRFGYPAVWFIIGAIAIYMIAYFRKKKWM
ncbi:MAG: magnesium/cobalt transporter CorA [Candidatus Omnitrophota bacterium]|nr:MAG: magnesium/cobalt transporter CorA [Candidatus Omnitrophota bacterium]